MIIPCGDIARDITHDLKARVSALAAKGKKVKLLAVLIGDEPAQHSYVRIKRNLAGSLGIGFELLHYPQAPPFEVFRSIIKEKSEQKDVSGVIVQLPLPQEYDKTDLYKAIPTSKEIEGHTTASRFVFPLVQACMIGLDWVYHSRTPSDKRYVLPVVPTQGLIRWLQGQRITIAGRGMTTGKPIASYFDSFAIPYEQTHSATADPDSIYRQSDIIICGVGKKILTRENIKRGVVLLNFGLQKREHRVMGIMKSKLSLVGDYDEDEIRDIASWYTITPGGLGPIDILCLYGNLIESATRISPSRNPNVKAPMSNKIQSPND